MHRTTKSGEQKKNGGSRFGNVDRQAGTAPVRPERYLGGTDVELSHCDVSGDARTISLESSGAFVRNILP